MSNVAISVPFPAVSFCIASSITYRCPVFLFVGRPVMIVVEYMENGSLDSFLRVQELNSSLIWHTTPGISHKCTYLEIAFCNLPTDR